MTVADRERDHGSQATAMFEEEYSMDRKATLSTAWIFVLLNVIFRDLHELFRPGMLAEMTTGTVNGVQVTEQTLLLAGVLLEIPIAMVILSRVLSRPVNRWANIVGAVLAIPLLLSAVPSDLDDIFFAGVEVVTLVLIIWYAWRWPDAGTRPTGPK